MNVDIYRRGFRLSGIDPFTDPAFRSSAARRAFWERAGRVAVAVKRRSLGQGLDKYDKEMAPISGLTREAREANVNPVSGVSPYSPMGRAKPDAPPLQATGRRSRTQKLFRAEVERNGVWLYWARDTNSGQLWGDVLARHARGYLQTFVYPRRGVGFVKARDVLGLSPRDQTEIAGSMARWWKANRAQYLEEAPRPYIPPENPRGVVQVEGTGSAGETYGPGTRYRGKTVNRGYEFLKRTERYRPYVPPWERPTPPPRRLKPAATTISPEAAAAFSRVQLRQPIPVAFRAYLPPDLASAVLWREVAGSSIGLDWWNRLGLALWLQYEDERRRKRDSA